MLKFFKSDSIIKVDAGLGLVFGWGIVCKVSGEKYYDTQGDHITEGAMLEATTDFSKGERTAGDMHVFKDGQVVHSFPLTGEIAKALGIQTDRTGWLVAVAPSPEVLNKFETGEYTGFSIGGERNEETVVEE